jgi:hypothetical protein
MAMPSMTLGVRFHATTSKPRRLKVAAMRLPIRPRPTKPTRLMPMRGLHRLGRMRLPLLSTLFGKESSTAARRERLEAMERVLSSTLRQLALTFTQVADAVEKRRLTRAGYEPQERFLERTDPGKK